MQVDKISLLGLLLAMLAVSSMVLIALQAPFPAFSYAQTSDRLISVLQDVGQKDSQFMWTSRVFDLIMQAIAIFAASAGCLVLLRTDKREDSK